MAQTLRAAMETYYRGERNKVVLIAGGSLLLVAAAIALCTAGVAHFARNEFYAGTQDEFASGFGLGVGILILPVLPVSLWRWLRAARVAAHIRSAPESPEALRAVGLEVRHVARVARWSMRRQNAALALGIGAVTSAVMLAHPFVVGVMACVLLFVASEQVIDHFTGERAVRYARVLGAMTVDKRG
jgi:hypothetical protein